MFTPPTDPNGSFWIKLEPWESDGVLVRIFDRWGNKVYENEQYTNATGWRGTGSAEGCISTPSCCPTTKSTQAR